MALVVIKSVFVVSLAILIVQIGHRLVYPELWSKNGSSRKHVSIQHGPRFDKAFEAWVSKEEGIALKGLLENISPEGRLADGSTPGTVVASPSKEHPDYFYQWDEGLGNYNWHSCSTLQFRPKTL